MRKRGGRIAGAAPNNAHGQAGRCQQVAVLIAGASVGLRAAAAEGGQVQRTSRILSDGMTAHLHSLRRRRHFGMLYGSS